LVNDFFIVRTVVDRSNIIGPSIDRLSSLSYGIVVKRKIGCAVLRNRIKRRLRAAFDMLNAARQPISGNVAYIVVVRQASVAELPFLDLCNHLKGLLKFYE
jgi:ribonuclease P protein component